MAKWILAACGRARMFGNIADAQEQLKCCCQRNQPQQEWQNSDGEKARGKNSDLDSQKTSNGSGSDLRAINRFDRRIDAAPSGVVERASGAGVSGRSGRIALAAQNRLEALPGFGELMAALFEECLRGQIADHFAPQACLRGRERSR